MGLHPAGETAQSLRECIQRNSSKSFSHAKSIEILEIDSYKCYYEIMKENVAVISFNAYS